MTRVLLVGYAPDSVDLSDPALPPGITAEMIQDGIAQALADMRRRGWQADFCSVRPDDTAAPIVEQTLAAASYIAW